MRRYTDQMESIEEVLSLTGKLREDLLFILNGITFDLEEIKSIDNEILRNIFHVHTLIFYSLSFFLVTFQCFDKIHSFGCQSQNYNKTKPKTTYNSRKHKIMWTELLTSIHMNTQIFVLYLLFFE